MLAVRACSFKYLDSITMLRELEVISQRPLTLMSACYFLIDILPPLPPVHSKGHRPYLPTVLVILQPYIGFRLSTYANALPYPRRLSALMLAVSSPILMSCRSLIDGGGPAAFSRSE